MGQTNITANIIPYPFQYQQDKGGGQVSWELHSPTAGKYDGPGGKSGLPDGNMMVLHANIMLLHANMTVLHTNTMLLHTNMMVLHRNIRGQPSNTSVLPMVIIN